MCTSFQHIKCWNSTQGGNRQYLTPEQVNWIKLFHLDVWQRTLPFENHGKPATHPSIGNSMSEAKSAVLF